jgi:hypothetical protein
MIQGAIWLPAVDGDPRARAIMRRHYSARHYRDGRNPLLFVGPGEKMVLLTPKCDALFVWRKFISDDGQEGVNCAVFRYEGSVQCRNSGHSHCASRMVEEACELAWQRWPGERLYTYVDPKKVRSSNPGYCFKRAGWRFVGKTKRGLHILERRPVS